MKESNLKHNKGCFSRTAHNSADNSEIYTGYKLREDFLSQSEYKYSY